MIGIVLAILGTVVTIILSLTFSIGSCIPSGYCYPDFVSLEVNPGTYLGTTVVVCGLAFAWVDLVRIRRRTSHEISQKVHS